MKNFRVKLHSKIEYWEKDELSEILKSQTEGVFDLQLAEGVIFNGKESVTRLYDCNSPFLVSEVFKPEEVLKYIMDNSQYYLKQLLRYNDAELELTYLT